MFSIPVFVIAALLLVVTRACRYLTDNYREYKRFSNLELAACSLCLGIELASMLYVCAALIRVIVLLTVM